MELQSSEVVCKAESCINNDGSGCKISVPGKPYVIGDRGHCEDYHVKRDWVPPCFRKPLFKGKGIVE